MCTQQEQSIPALVKPFCCRCGETGAAVGLCCWLLVSVAASAVDVSKLSVPVKDAPEDCVGDTKGPGAPAGCEGVTGVGWEVVALEGEATECTRP